MVALEVRRPYREFAFTFHTFQALMFQESMSFYNFPTSHHKYFLKYLVIKVLTKKLATCLDTSLQK